MKPKLVIFGGGTVSPVRENLALAAPSFGEEARKIYDVASKLKPQWEIEIKLTKMADYKSQIVTNEDVMSEIVNLIRNPLVKGVIFNANLCEYRGKLIDEGAGLFNDGHPLMSLQEGERLVAAIKPVRPDIKLAAFKFTVADSCEAMAKEARAHLIQNNTDIVMIENRNLLRYVVFNRKNDTVYNFWNDRTGAIHKVLELIE